MGRIQYQSRRCQFFLQATAAVIAVAGLGSLRAEPPLSFGLDPTDALTVDFDSAVLMSQEPPSEGSFSIRLPSAGNSDGEAASVTRHIAYWPKSYRGEKLFGVPGRELTDGRLALTVAAAEMAPPFDSYPISYPRLNFFHVDHEYRIRYAIQNRLTARTEIAHFTAVFYDSNKTRSPAHTRRPDDHIIHNDKPLKVVPAGKRQDLMSLTNGVRVINNFCVRVVYADKKETMFIVVIPDHFIRDMKAKR
jgi:hypothetical protein